MRKAFFQAFGIVIIAPALPYLIAAACIFGRSDEPLRQRLSRLVVAGFVYVVGVGLLYLRKWAALYFSVTLFWVGLSWALSAVQEIDFPWNLFWMAHGASMMLPLFVTIRVWSQLTWRGKGFF